MGERKIREDLITALKFLLQTDNVNSEQLFERCIERATTGHSKKSTRKEIKGTFKVMKLDEWNKLCGETVNANSIQIKKVV